MIMEEACSRLRQELLRKEGEIEERKAQMLRCEDKEHIRKALDTIVEEEGRKKEVKRRVKENSVLVVGDSMFGSCKFRELIVQSIGLMEDPAIEVITLSGKGTQVITSRVAKELAEGNFGTAVINGGVNDCRRNWSVDEVSEKVKSMLEQVDSAGQEAGVNQKVYASILPVPDKRGQQNADIVAVNERSNKKAKELGWSILPASHFYGSVVGEPNLELFRDGVCRSQPPNVGWRK